MIRDASSVGLTATSTAATFWSAPGSPGAALGSATAPKAMAVAAYVNEARWVVECPDCHSAQMADRDDRRYMCHECGNVAVGGLWRPVVWPKDVGGIETALEPRHHSNAHWLPGETVAALKRENADHGIGA